MPGKLKQFWIQHETKIVLCISLLLVAAISFEFGYLRGKEQKTDTIVIEKPAQGSKTGPGQSNDAITESDSPKAEKPLEKNNLASTETPASQKNCAFVGSKNSDKFYPPSCSYAKRIKPENVVCFANAQEALSQGRTQSSGCAK